MQISCWILFLIKFITLNFSEFVALGQYCKNIQFQFQKLSSNQNRKANILKHDLMTSKLEKSNQEGDISYHQDILRVKKIWKELKENEKTQKNKKNKEKNVQPIKQTSKKVLKINSPQNKTTKTIYSEKNSLAETQMNLRSNKQNKCSLDKDEVIQFSTSKSQIKHNCFNSIKPELISEKNCRVSQNIILSPQSQGLNGQKNFYQEIDKLKRTIEQKDYELSLMRVNNQVYLDRVNTLQRLLEEKQEQLGKLKTRQNELLGETCKLNSQQVNFDFGKIEYENYKNDSRRLLRMLQATQQYQQFAMIALEDEGVRFLHQANKVKKTKLDLPYESNMHFCACNKDYIPEKNLWVPEKIFDLGKKFLRDRQGELTQAQLELLLYELNRNWKQREKKIINSLNGLKAHQVGKYKRQLQNLACS